MNRINQLFKDKKREILSLYFCAGHPTPDSTADIIRTLAARGIDMVEIGIPFSDPMADGPVIQDAATKALRGGMTLRRLFDQLKDIRRDVGIPLLLMGYLNPILHHGFEAFCQDCAACGIDGAIIPDLPFQEYMTAYKPVADRYDLRIIMLITPETSEERIRLIDRLLQPREPHGAGPSAHDWLRHQQPPDAGMRAAARRRGHHWKPLCLLAGQTRGCPSGIG